MSERIVTVEIDENGNASIDLEGFQGKGCKAVADAFASLGTVTHDEVKPAYHTGGGSGNTITSGR